MYCTAGVQEGSVYIFTVLQVYKKAMFIFVLYCMGTRRQFLYFYCTAGVQEGSVYIVLYCRVTKGQCLYFYCTAGVQEGSVYICTVLQGYKKAVFIFVLY